MPVVNVHRYYEPPAQVGGTISATTLDLTNQLTFQLQPSVYTAAGTWTLVNFTTLIGSPLNIAITNNSGLLLTTLPYQSGNSIKIVLS
jgi:hypothetical protein